MVEDRTTDGKRIAQLLSSELSGREDSGLAALEVVNADPDATGSTDGELAYEIARTGDSGTEDGDGEMLADVYLHEDRVRIEFRAAVDAAAEAAEDVGLRIRPKAAEPPRTLAFVEDGAQVKRATDAFERVLQVLDDAR